MHERAFLGFLKRQRYIYTHMNTRLFVYMVPYEQCVDIAIACKATPDDAVAYRRLGHAIFDRSENTKQILILKIYC